MMTTELHFTVYWFTIAGFWLGAINSILLVGALWVLRGVK